MNKRIWRVLSVLTLTLTMTWAGAGPAGAVTVPKPPAPDAAVQIPGTPIPDTNDDGDQAVINDDYVLSRTAGDNPLNVETAAAARSTSAEKANQIRKGTQGVAPAGSPFAGSWAPIGPSPIIQVQRTDNALADVSGRIGALAIRKNGRFILGAAQGGIWTMDPGSNTWVARTDTLPSLATGALAVAPSNDNVIYDGTGEGAFSGDSYFGNGILKSTDGGNTWTHVSGDYFIGVSTARLAVDPTNENHVYAAIIRGRGGAHRTSPPVHSAFGLWESRDGGVTWNLIKAAPGSSLGATELRIDPITPNVLYASFMGDQMYKSADGGATWNPIMNGLPAGADYTGVPTRFSIGLSHPAGQDPVLYVGFDFVNGPNPPPGVGLPGAHRVARVFKSLDAGASWIAVQRVGGLNGVADYCGTQCTYDNVIETDPTNPNVVFAAGSFGYNLSPPSGGIFRSDDGGAHWKNLGWDQHPDFHALTFDPNNAQHILIGSDGGVWESLHQGGRVPGSTTEGDLNAVDWIDLNGNPNVDPAVDPAHAGNGLQIAQFSSIQTNPNRPVRFVGGTQDNGTMRKLAGLSAWYDITSGDGGNAQVDPYDSRFIYGTYFAPPTQIYRITDSGSNFFRNKFITHGINTGERAEFYMPLVLNQENTNQLFTGTFHVYRTDNAKTPSAGDVLWNSISPDLTTGCTGAAPNGARNCTITSIGVGGGTAVYVGTNDGLLWVSPDGQTSSNPTWIQLGKGVLPNRPVSGIAVDRSDWRTAYIAYNGFNAATPTAPGHIFKTTDGGKSFRDITGNLPDTPVNWTINDPAYPDTLYAATDVGPFVTYNGGKNWFALGAGIPIVGVDQISLDTFHRLLAAGTHGRGAWTLNDASAPAPALWLSTVDAGIPVGPGSFLDYTLTLSNVGNGAADRVHVVDPIPANTSFVSADNGGVLENGAVSWNGLSVATGTTAAAGGHLVLHFRVQIDPNLSSSVKSIVNDGTRFKDGQLSTTFTGSPTVTPIAPPFAVTISPASQLGAARDGSSVTYQETVKNLGYKTDTYALSASGGSFPITFLDSTCSSAITSTPALTAGQSTSFCVKVDVPAGTADSATSTSTVAATSTGSPTVSATSSLKTIAVAVNTLVVQEDSFTQTPAQAIDVHSYYTNALTANGQAFQLWNLGDNKNLPINYLQSFKYVVWFTGNSYPSPIQAYEAQLTAYLNGGGNLFLSGQDLLDQAGGTTPFVTNYLHVTWDGTDTQNDRATAHVNGVAATLTDGTGSVAYDNTVLGNDFEDEITPNGTATPIFTDDAGNFDGLSFSGGYKVVFLAFPFEAYGSASNQADLMKRVYAFFG